MPQQTKRYHFIRPDGSRGTEVFKISGAEDVSEDEIMNPEPEEEEEQEQEQLEEPGIEYPAEESETGETEYERRGRKKGKKKKKAVFFGKHPKAKKAIKSFLYKRPRKKHAITWRPRLDRHPKQKNIKFFQGKKQPERRSIIKRR